MVCKQMVQRMDMRWKGEASAPQSPGKNPPPHVNDFIMEKSHMQIMCTITNGGVSHNLNKSSLEGSPSRTLRRV